MGMQEEGEVEEEDVEEGMPGKKVKEGEEEEVAEEDGGGQEY